MITLEEDTQAKLASITANAQSLHTYSNMQHSHQRHSLIFQYRTRKELTASPNEQAIKYCCVTYYHINYLGDKRSNNAHSVAPNKLYHFQLTG